MIDAAGPLLFARYAYPPNALGLCGADQPRTLLEYGDAHAFDAGLGELAMTFDGAWPYLELIAHANRIEDPLDVRVVQAYWVGNELLDRVSSAELGRHLDDRFAGRIGRAQENLVDAVAAGAAPHHCFHVFAVYPWLGLLRSGVVDEPLRVLDLCRTTPGRVLSVADDHADVAVSPLAWNGLRLELGRPTVKTVRWRDGGLGFVPALRAGDIVSLHWDFVCDLLTPAEEQTLERVTARMLRVVNRTRVPAAMA